MEEKAHFLLVSEPNRKVIGRGGWYVDDLSDAAIKITDIDSKILDSGKGRGYVFIRTAECTIYSCYASPNALWNDYEDLLDALQGSIRHCLGKVLVAGDFNTKAHAWSAGVEDRRGIALADLMAGMDLVVLNRGNSPTFQRRTSSSIIDVTFASANLNIMEWFVSSKEGGSDHLPVIFETGGTEVETHNKRKGYKWDERRREAIVNCLKQNLGTQNRNSLEEINNIIIDACDNCLTSVKNAPPGKKLSIGGHRNWSNYDVKHRKQDSLPRDQYAVAATRRWYPNSGRHTRRKKRP